MKNYKGSDYALNKHSKGIVYRFADRIVEITIEDYLAENPDKTETDFLALKKQSDDIYHDQVRNENAQTYKNVTFDELGDILPDHTNSPEQTIVSAINSQEEAEKNRKRLDMANHALDKLTDVQRRRYLLYVIDGLNERQIAELEHTTQQAVSKSLLSAEKKIKKFLASA